MFASNVKDETIIPNVEARGGSIQLKSDINVVLSTQLDTVPTHSTEKPTAGSSLQKYLKDRNVNPDIVTSSYNDVFTSSLLRSLRRGESYEYGIVYYNKYGAHSNVLPITENSVVVPEIYDSGAQLTKIQDSKLYAVPYGVKITLPQPQTKDENGNYTYVSDIIGCQIVRRSSKDIYQKTLL